MRTHSIAVVATALVTGGLVRSAPIVRAGPPGAAGTISGKVTFTGTPPKMKPIDMAKEPNCVTQHAGAPPIHTKWELPEFIPVKCNVHPWMHGWHMVLATSHYAVTDENGAFSLSGLAPGKYTVTAWQEQFGTQTQDVTISGTETKAVDFVFKARPYWASAWASCSPSGFCSSRSSQPPSSPATPGGCPSTFRPTGMPLAVS